ncbi:MAG: SMP-30/gluconolactonase/LRE family protein [Planctomycetaceae bacterium]
MTQAAIPQSRQHRTIFLRLLAQACGCLALLTLFVQVVHAGDIVPEGVKVEKLWNEGEFTEGVAVAPDGTIYFSDIPAVKKGRILKFDPATGKTSVFCADSGKSNGLMFDRKGRLIAACGANDGHRALCEFMTDGDAEVLVGKFKGNDFNSPNDIVVHPHGDIYFTDPRYVGDEPLELDHMSVFRFSPSTKTISRASREITKPNGIVCSPEGKIMYVSENNNGDDFGGQQQPSRRQLLACAIQEDGALGEQRVLVDFGDKGGIDGMTVDQEGNIYAAVREESRPGIVVFAPSGKEIAYIKTDEMPSNCCFGRGDEASMLYITAGGGLYRISLNIPGYHPATAEQ